MLERRKLTRSIFLATWIWLMLVWIYVVIDRWIFPADQYYDFAIWLPFEETYVGGFCFVAAWPIFVAWHYLKSTQTQE